MMRFGLKEQAIDGICKVLARHPLVDKAVLYGSRAKGNYKPSSDIDLSLHGAGISFYELCAIDAELDDLLLPYTIDLLIFNTLSHVELRAHIERVGVIFYQRGNGIEDKGE
jgi:predicted nucleotidyltransferase